MYHVNSKGEPGKCKAEKQCPFGGDDQHFTSEVAAREAFENKMASKELAKAEIERAIKEVRKKLSDFHAANRYPSTADPRLKALHKRYADLDEARAREEYAIPTDWKTIENYNGGASFRPPKGKTGPNGSPLEISSKAPSRKPTEGRPEAALYVQTSAGIFISGPYSTPDEAAAGLSSYSGPSSPGRIGWD